MLASYIETRKESPETGPSNPYEKGGGDVNTRVTNQTGK